MPETAETVIRSSLQEILVQASEQPIQPTEFTDAVKYLNRMMLAWDVRGYTLGYTVVSGPADEITVPDGAIEAIVLNLAIKLAPQYDRAVSPDLRESARQALLAVSEITVTVSPTQFPGTLPIGSGNEGGYPLSQHFYRGQGDPLLSEVNGNMIQEDNNDANE